VSSSYAVGRLRSHEVTSLESIRWGDDLSGCKEKLARVKKSVRGLRTAATSYDSEDEDADRRHG
jgi:hypothetical protein